MKSGNKEIDYSPTLYDIGFSSTTFSGIACVSEDDLEEYKNNNVVCAGEKVKLDWYKEHK